MGRIRYIGSKVRIAEKIFQIIGKPRAKNSKLVDLFSGTGTISRSAISEGWSVRANDYLFSSSLVTKAQLLCKEQVAFQGAGSYADVVDHLNALELKQGFITREYSPSGKSSSGHTRKYFTIENASKIDSIRLEIEDLYNSNLLTEDEYHLLIADLLEASNKVANIAGTYGCFLSAFAKNSTNSLRLEKRELLDGKSKFIVLNEDSFGFKAGANEVVYIDPPYTKRQYPAYYHILETIAHNDEPQVNGITGLRPWKDKSSPFCFKKKAPGAFVKLLSGIDAKEIYISYSSEGHVPVEELVRICETFGKIEVHDLGIIGRYAPNTKAISKNKEVKEFLIHIDQG